MIFATSLHGLLLNPGSQPGFFSTMASTGKVRQVRTVRNGVLLSCLLSRLAFRVSATKHPAGRSSPLPGCISSPLDDIRQSGAPYRCATCSAGATPQRGGVSCWRIYGRNCVAPCAFDHAPYWLASLGALGGTSQYWRGWTPHLPALRCLTGCLRHPSSGRTPCGGTSSGPPERSAPGQPQNIYVPP